MKACSVTNRVNYLAHVYLVNDSSELLIGSMLGDFVKGAIPASYPPSIRQGIQLHRQIDTYTDSHPIVLRGKQLISPARRRFAGIMLDLFYDHFLAQHWATYSTLPLSSFVHSVYATLLEHQAVLPERLRTMLPYMIDQDWLCSYRELSGIDRALNGLSRRLKRENSLQNSVIELEQNYVRLEQTFHDFFPQLIRFVHQYQSQGA